MGGWGLSLELTNQGSFPLVFGVHPILHLIFFAISQILIQKSITLFFLLGWGMAGLEMGYLGLGARAGSSR